MEMNFTPGPWKLFDKNETREMVMGPRGFHVASVPTFEAEDRANAALIAAAPDLFAALDEVQRHGALSDRLMKIARDALIKAMRQP